jgi:hypothetical protein
MNRLWMPVSLPIFLSWADFRANTSTWPGLCYNERANYVPSQFGLGSRTCIGRHVPMLEMCKLIPPLVRDFEFALHDNLFKKE